VSRASNEPLFRKVDCLQIPVLDLESGLAFYRDRLGHELIWRTRTAAGLRMPESDAELVIQTERPHLEANLLVASADEAARRFCAAGGEIIAEPFDIQIGRCAALRDPWGNVLVLLDGSKGRLATDAEGNVIGVEQRSMGRAAAFAPAQPPDEGDAARDEEGGDRVLPHSSNE